MALGLGLGLLQGIGSIASTGAGASQGIAPGGCYGPDRGGHNPLGGLFGTLGKILGGLFGHPQHHRHHHCHCAGRQTSFGQGDGAFAQASAGPNGAFASAGAGLRNFLG